ncbi:IucA/IucC family protein [Salimicrobium flavidum]|uniref:Siderophore synthetase component n=1 Tax=Salimicrobium flavidum TaxID=570947 RepID=A0A1N7KFA3_9BACI|nr:IucA/IucC family protein [Salimicrobium flavidum]SIS60262.1 Siderophore synthetase component [Salimicrobium flavidum]
MMVHPIQSLATDKMMEEEKKCLRFLERDKPHYAPQFLRYISAGRNGILHKMASAVLREGLYEKAEDVHAEDGRLIQKVLRFPEYSIVIPIRAVYAFNRIETNGNIIRIDDQRETVVQTASELAGWLFSKEEYPNLGRFQEELDNGTANLTLAYAARSLSGIGEEKGSLFFEQLVTEGHHLHPGAKTKLGLSYKDAFRYSPEFGHTFPVRFVAVRKSLWKSNEPEPVQTYYPDLFEQGQKELTNRGYQAEEFVLVPIHEWQYFHAIPSIYEGEIAEGDVLLLEDVSLPAKATSSFRTVVPASGSGPALKLAVNSQMTSTVRSISPQTAGNAAVVSELLQTIFDRESFDGFVPLYELGGGSFDSEDTLKKRNLTMLMREDIDPFLEEGEEAIAGMALYADDPDKKGTVLQRRVREFAVAENMSPEDAAPAFFREYARTILPPYLTLMIKYGVALEGHLQNSVPVFRNGHLTRFFFRDWGGTRFYKQRLEARGYRPDFMEGSVSVTEDVAAMHHKLYYSVFQNHIGEIIRQLVEETGTEEEDFWLIVKEICGETCSRMGEEVPEEAEIDRDFLKQKTVMHKSLTKMRLYGEKEEWFSEVSNPLYEGEEG